MMAMFPLFHQARMQLASVAAAAAVGIAYIPPFSSHLQDSFFSYFHILFVTQRVNYKRYSSKSSHWPRQRKLNPAGTVTQQNVTLY